MHSPYAISIFGRLCQFTGHMEDVLSSNILTIPRKGMVRCHMPLRKFIENA